jgi:DNA polymerase V
MLNSEERAPLSSALTFYCPDSSPKIAIPLFTATVQAGFPSPAEDYQDAQLDLHKLLIPNPSATFFVKAQGESMRDAGIGDGDLLVVDRAITANDGHVAVCYINGGFTVKRLNFREDGIVRLMPANPDMAPIILNDSEELRVFGVVSYVIKRVSQCTRW